MSRQRLHLLANAKSGQGLGASLPQIGQELCQELGAELIVHEINSPSDLDQQARKAIAAAKTDGGTVVAAGGDGTIRGVAQHAAGEDVAFAVVPCGTFNFFARTHHIPEDPREAFRLALTGELRPVRLGEFNGEVFLINASLGLYARAIREREARTRRWGRYRIVAIISTILSLLGRQRLLKVDLMMGAHQHSTYTPMIFIGNNALQLRDLAMDVARCMKKDLLAAVMMKPLSKLEVLRVILRGLTKTLEKDDSLETFCVDSLTIVTRKSAQTVALDGELFRMSSPFTIRALPKVLKMRLPPRELRP